MKRIQKTPYHTWILAAGLMLFPFQIRLSLLMLIVYLIASSDLRNPQIPKDKSVFYMLVIPVLFYLLYVVSLIYTDNVRHGLKDLETKAALIIIPLVMIFYQRNMKERHLFSNWYIVSFTIASFYLLTDSFLTWYSSGDGQSFYYDQFSDLMHPTYFTMCLTLGLMLTLEKFASGKDVSGSRTGLLYMVLFTLTVSMFLTSSRAGLSVGWLMVLLQMVFYLVQRRMKFHVPLFVICVMIFSVTALSPDDSRFRILINEVTSSQPQSVNSDSAKVDISPVSHRMILYKSALSLIAENPVGVGVGDVQDELVEIYKKVGYQKAVDVRYNPHNQYLQSAVAIGWAGLGMLVLFLAGLFVYGVRNQDLLLAGLAAITGLNALFESVLEVQRGVLFFAVCLLFLMVKREKVPGPEQPVK